MGDSRELFQSSVRSTPQPRGAFTLLEVLLALAVLSLIATVLISGSARLLTEQPVTPTDVFWRAVQEARKTALKLERDVRLRYDKDKKLFMIVDAVSRAPATNDPASVLTKEEQPLKTLPIPIAGEADFTVDFLGAGTKGAAMILVGGVLLESQPLPYVTFYPDGTCSAFRAQFMRSGAASILAVDPWTCAPILTPSEPAP